MSRLSRSFYQKDTVAAAREILGKILVRDTGKELLSGRIVEAEAYTGPGDPASHAYRGPTPRSRIMFGPPGYAYVYFCYGNHSLLNAVTEEEGRAGAVLIRGLDPVEGLGTIRKNRGNVEDKNLLNGPGKLTRGLEITLPLNGEDLVRGSELWIEDGQIFPGERIISTPRIGIKKGTERLWRFVLENKSGPGGPL